MWPCRGLLNCSPHGHTAPFSWQSAVFVKLRKYINKYVWEQCLLLRTFTVLKCIHFYMHTHKLVYDALTLLWLLFIFTLFYLFCFVFLLLACRLSLSRSLWHTMKALCEARERAVVCVWASWGCMYVYVSVFQLRLPPLRFIRLSARVLYGSRLTKSRISIPKSNWIRMRSLIPETKFLK